MSTTPPFTGRTLLRRVLALHRRRLAAAALCYSGHQVGEALVPVTIGLVIDHAVADGSPATVAGWLGVLAGVFVMLSLSYRFGARLSMRVKQSGAHELRMMTTRRILDPKGGVDRSWHPGELVSIASSDASRVGDFAGMVAYGVAASAALVFAAVVVLRLSIGLGLLVLLGGPCLLVATRLLSRRLESRSAREQEAAAQTAALATDIVQGLRVLQGVGASETAAERYRRRSRLAREHAVAATTTLSSLSGLAVLFNGCYLAAIALVGGQLALSGSITAGGLVSALGLAQFLLGPLRMIAALNMARSRALASATRIAAVLEAPAAVSVGDVTPARALGGELRFEDLTYGSLRGCDLTAAAGRLTGVMSDPEQAHDALACLTRDAEPGSGRILLGGVDIATLHPPALRQAMIVSGHRSALFSGSVQDNVAVGAGSDAAVAEAMTAAKVDDVLPTLPVGAATDVGEGGNALSGGQRQRVALARALAARSPVLVLHDPTSAVDSATEAEVADGIARTRRGLTTVIFTSSPTLLAVCEDVLMLAPDGAGGLEARTVGAEAEVAAR